MLLVAWLGKIIYSGPCLTNKTRIFHTRTYLCSRLKIGLCFARRFWLTVPRWSDVLVYGLFQVFCFLAVMFFRVIVPYSPLTTRMSWVGALDITRTCESNLIKVYWQMFRAYSSCMFSSLNLCITWILANAFAQLLFQIYIFTYLLCFLVRLVSI